MEGRESLRSFLELIYLFAYITLEPDKRDINFISLLFSQLLLLLEYWHDKQLVKFANAFKDILGWLDVKDLPGHESKRDVDDFDHPLQELSNQIEYLEFFLYLEVKQWALVLPFWGRVSDMDTPIKFLKKDERNTQ